MKRRFTLAQMWNMLLMSVELGTVRAPAYPYLRPAIEEHMGDFKEITQKHLQGG